MPTWRKLHTKTVESLDINDMPDDFTRLVWIMLPLALDREGRGLDNTGWIKSRIMPLRLDVTLDMIGDAMAWFADHGMTRRYEVDDRPYFYVPTFHKYQGSTIKEAASNYPAPPAESDDSAVPSPDLLQTNSITDSDSDVDIDADADADASSALVSEPVEENHVAAGIRAFENAIGTLGGERQCQDIGQTLDELHDRGIDDWWQTAIDIAVDNNKRSWAYVRAILDNHIRDGTAPIRKAGPLAARPKAEKQTIKVLNPDGTTRQVEAMI